jgi:subtilase family serine protease
MSMPRSSPRRRLLVPGAVAAAMVALNVVGAAAPAQAAGRTAYPDARPAWATPAAAAGTPAADTTIESEVALSLRDEAGAEAFAAAVSTPGNRQFHRYLTPKQWIDRYAPTRSDLDAVLTYLRGQGLTITAVPDSRLFVVLRGTPEQLGAAFGTTLEAYRHEGRTLAAPAGTPSLPAAVAAKVRSVSLDQGRLLTRPAADRADTTARATRAAAAAPTVTCSDYYGQHTATYPKAYGKTVFPTNLCGYTPKQIRAIYGLTSGPRGAGQTIGIVDAYASPTILADVNTYSAAVGEPGLTSRSYKQVVPAPGQFSDQEACGFPSGWQGEQTLDVESAHGIAPQATIVYSGGFNCNGGIDIALSTILDRRLATIVSNSYSFGTEDVGDEAIINNLHQEWQAAAEGIGLYYSSGDDGDDATADTPAAPEFAASSPWVTAVGGTSVGLDADGRVRLETGWGDTRDKVVGSGYADPLPGTFYGGAGGGPSHVFAEPAYQRGVVPAALAGGKRVVPDVSALADPYTGFSIGIRPIVDDATLETGPFENETYGGTSLASPIVAAEVAVAQQATRSTLGFANPVLYAAARVPGIYRDVLPAPATALAAYSTGLQSDVLVTLDTDTSLRTTRGYDDVTGIGSLTFDGWRRLVR